MGKAPRNPLSECGKHVMRLGAALLMALSAPLAAAESANVAPTPPMGWNSWDAYGLTVTEAQFKANVERLATILGRPLQLSLQTA